MGITVATENEYSASIHDLFPKGEYWEKQFSNPESDVNLFCKAKTQEIIRIRERMRDLFSESYFETANETIDDWERILLNNINAKLPLNERIKILSTKKVSVINKTVIADIAKKYGLILVDIVFPFKPSFFGFSGFGNSIFSRPAFFSVFYIITIFQSEEVINEARECINKLFHKSSFGKAFFGTGQFLGQSYFDQHYENLIFSGINELNKFEDEVINKLLSGNIAYFQYRF